MKCSEKARRLIEDLIVKATHYQDLATRAEFGPVFPDTWERIKAAGVKMNLTIVALDDYLAGLESPHLPPAGG